MTAKEFIKENHSYVWQPLDKELIIEAMEEYAGLKVKEEQQKLRNLLEGLEAENVDRLLKVASADDLNLFGSIYVNAVKNKVEAKAKEAYEAGHKNTYILKDDENFRIVKKIDITYEQWKQSKKEQ